MVEVHKVSGAAFDGNVYLVLDRRPILVDAGMMAGPTLKNIKRFIDPTKIETELGWRAQETFDTGLRKTVQWYLANPHWWQRIRSGVYRGERLGTAL